MLRGVDGPLDHVGMKRNEVSIGGVVACQQSLLREPLAVVATENGLELFTVRGGMPAATPKSGNGCAEYWLSQVLGAVADRTL